MTQTDHQVAHYFDLIVERMIPPEGQWPSAASLRVGEDVLGHLRISERNLVDAALERLAPYEDFVQMSGTERDLALRDLENQEPSAFALIRQIAYLAYYAQPAVISLLQKMGHDINLTPGPVGYRMDPFSKADIPLRSRGVWIPTEQVKVRTESRVS